MSELRDYLRKIANKDALFDDEESCIADYAGGNYDDSYTLGTEDGEISLARELLAKFFHE